MPVITASIVVPTMSSNTGSRDIGLDPNYRRRGVHATADSQPNSPSPSQSSTTSSH